MKRRSGKVVLRVVCFAALFVVLWAGCTLFYRFHLLRSLSKVADNTEERAALIRIADSYGRISVSFFGANGVQVSAAEVRAEVRVEAASTGVSEIDIGWSFPRLRHRMVDSRNVIHIFRE